jgi:hypothetical protein
MGIQFGAGAAEPLDERPCSEALDGVVDHVVGSVGSEVGEVLVQCCGEYVGLLWDQCAMTRGRRRIQLGGRGAAEQHRAVLGFEQAGDQGGERGLSRAAGADDREVLVLGDDEVKVVDHRLAGGSVAEGDVAQQHVVTMRLRGPQASRRLCVGGCFGFLDDPCERDEQPQSGVAKAADECLQRRIEVDHSPPVESFARVVDSVLPWCTVVGKPRSRL